MNKKRYNFSLDVRSVITLNAVAKKRGISTSQLIDYLARNLGDPIKEREDERKTLLDRLNVVNDEIDVLKEKAGIKKNWLADEEGE